MKSPKYTYTIKTCFPRRQNKLITSVGVVFFIREATALIGAPRRRILGEWTGVNTSREMQISVAGLIKLHPSVIMAAAASGPPGGPTRHPMENSVFDARDGKS